MARRREKQGETSRCCSRCCSRSARSCSNCNKASAIARCSVAGSVAALHARHSAASQPGASHANKTCSASAVQCMAVQCSVRRVGHQWDRTPCVRCKGLGKPVQCWQRRKAWHTYNPRAFLRVSDWCGAVGRLRYSCAMRFAQTCVRAR